MKIDAIREMEKRWLEHWRRTHAMPPIQESHKKKFYCLDMFPYPSGAGLHVGHPRGYITTDVLSRFKRMQGYNVLHPMGFDAFGLPAEQYAIETGQHPRVTTAENIVTFRKQLQKLGLFYDTTRELNTSDPAYYRWTQWVFSRLFDSWFNLKLKSARPICELLTHLENHGTNGLEAFTTVPVPALTANDWAHLDSVRRSDFLMNYRLAYRARGAVNWCPKLGTVLANDEVIDGLSERGGHPVIKRSLEQWMLRITAYADRLVDGLANVQWPQSVKEMQLNWIGRTNGATFSLSLCGEDETAVRVFVTQPDQLDSATFVLIPPQHPLVNSLTLTTLREDMANYLYGLETRRACQGHTLPPSGRFTGNYVLHPSLDVKLPIWVSDYNLSGADAIATMGMPAVDPRAAQFATQFGIAPTHRSPTLRDTPAYACVPEPATHYRLRDAVFGRQRYWGEPIPIFYDEDGVPKAIPDEHLPLELPEIDAYSPTEQGEPPLERAQDWRYRDLRLETTTMPGWAGSSWYFLRYADPQNAGMLISPQSAAYWSSVDLYVGGAEHTAGHLLYARFWTHFLNDLGVVDFCEPFDRLVCQGMILGNSAIIYRDPKSQQFISADLRGTHELQPLYIDVSLINEKNEVDITRLRQWRSLYRDADFRHSEGRFLCERRIEKMSKSKHNVINPDDIVERYGADAFRLHSLFLGPIEKSAVWSTESIEGAYKFVQRVSSLFIAGNGKSLVESTAANREELKVLHEAIDTVTTHTESLSFNLAIAALMVCASKLKRMNCHKPSVLKVFLQLLYPYAPFIAQELWSSSLNLTGDICDSEYPIADATLLYQSHYACPVTINGKLRSQIMLCHDMSTIEIETRVLNDASIAKFINAGSVKKIIIVKDRLVNIVLDC